MMTSKILWLDTETTGTDPARNGMAQIAGIIEIDGKEKDAFNLHVRPFDDDIIDDTALAVNGFTRDELAGFPPPTEVHGTIVEVLSRHVDRYNRKDKLVFAGYNAQFDLNFMHAFFKKCGDSYFGSWVWWPGLDVSVLAMQRLMPVRHLLPNFKLTTLADYLHITPKGEAHDAMADIRMTRAIYRHLFSEESQS